MPFGGFFLHKSVDSLDTRENLPMAKSGILKPISERIFYSKIKSLEKNP
jgi:hypothetical protein